MPMPMKTTKARRLTNDNHEPIALILLLLLLILTLVAAAACAPGVLRGGEQLADIDEQMWALESQLEAGADSQVCQSYRELCGLAAMVCISLKDDVRLGATCDAVTTRCKDNLAAYCVDPPPPPSGDAAPPPLAPDAGPSPVADRVVIEAESGDISAPFVVQDGAISQPSETNNPQAGGRAAYSFTVQQGGDYVVKGLVNAPNGGANSFFINVDAEPSGSAMIWDVQLTNGFEERTVRWRGSGSYAAPAIDPKLFALSAGEHTLIIRGRERNTKLDRLVLERVGGGTPEAPPAQVDAGMAKDQGSSTPDPTTSDAGGSDPLPPSPDSGTTSDPPGGENPPVIQGTTWYVDNTATGSNSGTSWADAWTSFASIAWGQIKPGDGILISGGSASKTYRETLVVGASGEAGKPIVVARGTAAGHDGQVIIDGQNSRSIGIQIRPRRYVTLSGFRILGHTARDVYISGSSGSTYSSGGASSHIIIENMDIFTMARGVFIQTSDNIVVRHSRIETPTYSAKQTDGIYSQRNHDNVYDGNSIIVYNTDPNGHDDCIQMFQDTSTVVRNNYIGQVNDKSGNAQGIYATDMHGTTRYYNNVVNLGNAQSNGLSFRRLSGTGTVEVIGNTVYSNRAYHTGSVTETADPVIKNNIFFTLQGSTALDLTGWSGTASNIDNNLYWAAGSRVASLNGSSKTWSAWQSYGFDASGVNAEPQVVSVSNKDFHLQSGSPAIDKGTALGSPYDVDKDGVARPKGSGWDIGAYER